ncbi:MAG: hypothetical protein Q8918_17665 [Bacteroidota bacterium]|nr:hypothetical protein [Bacteroidota bacterium]
MSLTYLLPALLSVHLIALILMAGTTLVDFITLRSFWRLFEKQKEKGSGLLEATASYARMIGIGAALLIFTGIGMMFITHGVFGEQLWFRIKFAFVLLLVANGIFVGRRLGLRLRKTVAETDLTNPNRISQLRKNLYRFHISQLLIFTIIIFLSIFKFN